ncbi:MAG: DUF1631 family protein [Pseudomonadales bacterium]|nr:DUF1631 family protein [Pseudomonadales bacterium]
MDTPSAEVIDAVLRGHYTPPKPPATFKASPKNFLSDLTKLAKEDNVDPILVLLEKHYPDITLSATQHGILAFIDDSLSEILAKTDVDFRIETHIRNLAPLIAQIAIEKTPVAIMGPHPLLSIVDLLIQKCLGWSEDLGILGEQFIDKTDGILKEFIAGKLSISDCDTQLRTFFDKEQINYDKRESQLCDAQMHVFNSQKGRFIAADTLNKLMLGQSLPLFIIFMFQGTWFAFLQDIVNEFGEESVEWQGICEISASIISAMQHGQNETEQLKLINQLPSQIEKFTQALDFKFKSIENCMEDVVTEFEAIKNKQASPACDFDLLTLHESTPITKITLIERMSKLKNDQWFLFDDKTESDEKVARLKLILNWPETQKLLFTNHNRRKVLVMSYGEFSDYNAKNVISTITALPHIFESIRSTLANIIQLVRQQKNKVTKVQEKNQRIKINRNYIDTRKLAMETTLQKQQQRAKIKYQRALILRKKAKKKILLAQDAVSKLNVDAWVKLPLMEGVLTPCRLVAIVSAVNTYIFTNRAGIKVAEHTASQLSQMIVTENSEILDTGAEFENVLANVITGLREDKNKSYDELSGTQ